MSRRRRSLANSWTEVGRLIFAQLARSLGNPTHRVLSPARTFEATPEGFAGGHNSDHALNTLFASMQPTRPRASPTNSALSSASLREDTSFPATERCLDTRRQRPVHDRCGVKRGGQLDHQIIEGSHNSSASNSCLRSLLQTPVARARDLCKRRPCCTCLPGYHSRALVRRHRVLCHSVETRD